MASLRPGADRPSRISRSGRRRIFASRQSRRHASCPAGRQGRPGERHAHPGRRLPRRAFPDLQRVEIVGDGLERDDTAALHGLAVAWQRPVTLPSAPSIAFLSRPSLAVWASESPCRAGVAGLATEGSITLNLESPDGTTQSAELKSSTGGQATFLLVGGAAVTPGRFEWKLRLAQMAIPWSSAWTWPPPYHADVLIAYQASARHLGWPPPANVASGSPVEIDARTLGTRSDCTIGEVGRGHVHARTRDRPFVPTSFHSKRPGVPAAPPTNKNRGLVPRGTISAGGLRGPVGALRDSTWMLPSVANQHGCPARRSLATTSERGTDGTRSRARWVRDGALPSDGKPVKGFGCQRARGRRDDLTRADRKKEARRR